MTTFLPICATTCIGSLLGSELNIGWQHWYGVICWALIRPILLSSVAPHKVHGAPAPSVQPNKVFSVYHLHAPPPGRNVPLQWLVPQFGMASLSLTRTLSQTFLSQLKAVLFGRVGIGSSSEGALYKCL